MKAAPILKSSQTGTRGSENTAHQNIKMLHININVLCIKNIRMLSDKINTFLNMEINTVEKMHKN